MKNKYIGVKAIFISKKAFCFYIIMSLLLISLFFSNNLEYLFMLKPDYKQVNNCNTTISFLNCGNANSVAINVENDISILIDTGGADFESNLNFYLKNNLVKNNTINYLIISHTDFDHSANLLYLLKNYLINCLYLPNNYSEKFDIQILNEIDYLVNSNLLTVKINFAGEKIKYNNLNIITFITPSQLSYMDNNDYSPILLFNYNNKSVIITNDATSNIGEVEAMNSDLIYDLSADVLLLGHHGSKYSTSYEFLQRVNPTFAVISYGENTYGHPDSETLQRIAEYNFNNNTNILENTYKTFLHGNVVFGISNNSEIMVTTIKNFNNYLYLDYYICVTIMILVLSIILCLPIIRFYINVIIKKLHKKTDNV